VPRKGGISAGCDVLLIEKTVGPEATQPRAMVDHR
jgi:hypothetical protein